MEEEASRWVGFEKMRVASWHIQTLSHLIPSIFEQVCPYSHYNMLGKWSTWKLTLTPPPHPNKKNKNKKILFSKGPPTI